MMTGVDFSFTVHGPGDLDYAPYLNYPVKVRRAKFVAAISSFCRSQIFRWVPHELWDKVVVIRCGIDAPFFGYSTPSPGDSDRLLCIGRLCEQKGQLLLLEATAQVLASGRNMHLVLAGDGEMREEIERRITELGLTSYVTITGWVNGEEIRELLTSCRAMVLPSFAEGLPVVLMESLALRRPVITTSVAGIPELITSGDCGWLIPAGDITALTDAMNACLDAPMETLQIMGERGYKRVADQHHAKQEAARLVELLLSEQVSTNAPSKKSGELAHA
jgi:glycosyltransferase involved in cell wall biosynthesis